MEPGQYADFATLRGRRLRRAARGQGRGRQDRGHAAPAVRRHGRHPRGGRRRRRRHRPRPAEQDQGRRSTTSTVAPQVVAVARDIDLGELDTALPREPRDPEMVDGARAPSSASTAPSSGCSRPWPPPPDRALSAPRTVDGMTNGSRSSEDMARSPGCCTRCCSGRGHAPVALVAATGAGRLAGGAGCRGPAARHRGRRRRGVRRGVRGLRRRGVRRRRRPGRQPRAQAHGRPRGLAEVDRGRPARRDQPVRADLRDQRRRAGRRRRLPVWRAYVEAKRDADAALRASGLDWTILRPGGSPTSPAPAWSPWERRTTRRDPPRRRRRGPSSPSSRTTAPVGRQWNLVEGSDVDERARRGRRDRLAAQRSISSTTSPGRRRAALREPVERAEVAGRREAGDVEARQRRLEALATGPGSRRSPRPGRSTPARYGTRARSATKPEAKHDVVDRRGRRRR